ncbi:hypothetical protein [Mycobacterium tuberculosis]|uniref:hypothetical protein n=1 Tax=Mycobacterium tuberculosis TaxID=1773 RepID=UPI00272C2B8B|nr:hypothetical protein [Mycobacterium tuberculosis]
MTTRSSASRSTKGATVKAALAVEGQRRFAVGLEDQHLDLAAGDKLPDQRGLEGVLPDAEEGRGLHHHGRIADPFADIAVEGQRRFAVGLEDQHLDLAAGDKLPDQRGLEGLAAVIFCHKVTPARGS